MIWQKNRWIFGLTCSLFAFGLVLFFIQISYILLHERLWIEYVDHRLFYIINIWIILSLFIALLLIFSFKKIFISLASILVALFIMANIYLLAEASKEVESITSISPNFSNVFSIKKANHGGANYYRTYFKIIARSKATLSDPVLGNYHIRWLTNDVAVFTYETEDQRLMAFIGTYGDRNDGLSYYNVGPEIQGSWEKKNMQVVSGQDGIVVSEYDREEFFAWDQIEQFGTLALVLYKDGEAAWTIALGEDFNLQEKENGTILLYKNKLENDEVHSLEFAS